MQPNSGPNKYQKAHIDNRWDNLIPVDDEQTRRAATESFQRYLEEDTPDHPWQKIAKRQLNPNLVGALTAIGTAAVLTADIALNGPSGFVVNHPEAATTALAAGAGAIGAITSKIVSEQYAKEIRGARQAEREQRKHERSNQW